MEKITETHMELLLDIKRTMNSAKLDDDLDDETKFMLWENERLIVEIIEALVECKAKE